MTLVAVCIIIIGIIGATELSAQTTTANLRGTVADPSAAPIPGAEVTVTNTDTGLTRKVTTSEVGDYVIADLPYGPYEIVVEKQGFQRLSRKGVILNVGDRATVDLQLALGEVSETMTVTGQAPLLRTADASLGQVIDNAKVENIPLVGRSFDQLLYLAPGSQVSPTGQYSGVSYIVSAGPAIGVSFNGMRTEMNDYQFKLVKLQGDFIWHDHKHTDETFIILQGTLRIDFRDGAVHVSAGEMFVVPKGVEHKPFAEHEVKLLLIEPRGVLNTGHEGGERTAENDVWI
jgi:mannose-6-phosphate isomerase-like protein (cupin superfamily)